MSNNVVVCMCVKQLVSIVQVLSQNTRGWAFFLKWLTSLSSEGIAFALGNVGKACVTRETVVRRQAILDVAPPHTRSLVGPDEAGNGGSALVFQCHIFAHG